MEYFNNLNQYVAWDIWKLKPNETILCSYYINNSFNWVRTRIPDKDGDYLCIALKKLAKELPYISEKVDNFRRILKILVEKGIFEKKTDEDNSRIVYYRVKKECKELWKKKDYKKITVEKSEHTDNNSEHTDNNSEHTDNNSEHTDNNPTIIETFHKNNHKNNNHNKKDNDYFFNAILKYYSSNFKPQSKPKIRSAREEFARLIKNEDTETIAKEIALSLSNYLKTKDVQKNLGTASKLGFISNLYAFLTKYEDYIDIDDLIQGGEIDQNYIKKSTNGAVKNYNQKLRDSFTPTQQADYERWQQLVATIKAGLNEDDNFDVEDLENYDDSWVEKLLTEQEYKLFVNDLGWIGGIANAALDGFAQDMIEKKYNLGRY